MRHIKLYEEFANEAMDTKYWEDYNTDTSGRGKKEYEEKSKDFEDAFEDAVDYWNEEAEGEENRIEDAQIQEIKKLAQEFFKKTGWISINVVQAMIAQESMNEAESREFAKDKSETLQLAIAKAINEIDESMSYQDFAIAVAKVLKEDYGSQNFQPFMKSLKDELEK
jgi:hypothetical protein